MHMKLLALAMVVFSAGESLSQDRIVVERSRTKAGVLSAISNPNSKAMLARYALNPSIAKELKLSVEQLSLLRQILERSNGSFASVSVQNRPGEKPEEVRERLLTLKRQNERDLDEILPPEVFERLRQCVLQAEIARLGLGRALTEGFVGEEVGIHEEQKSNISQKAEKIQADLEESIKKLNAEALAKLSLELTAEQRSKLNSILGPPIHFKDSFDRP